MTPSPCRSLIVGICWWASPLLAFAPSTWAAVAASAAPGAAAETTSFDAPLPEAHLGSLTIFPRDELPVLTLAMAIPDQPPSPWRAHLVAALLEDATTWRDTPLAPALRAGASLQVRLLPGGWQWVFEGPAETISAWGELFPLGVRVPQLLAEVTPDALARAKATVLRRRALDAADGELSGQDALAERFWGPTAAAAALSADELEIVQAEREALTAEIARWPSLPRPHVTLEGRVAAQPREPATKPSPARPRWPTPDVGAAERSRPDDPRFLWVGHPIPVPLSFAGAPLAALVDLIADACRADPQLTGLRVAVLDRPEGHLLTFVLPIAQGEGGAAAVYGERALRTALYLLRTRPPPLATVEAALAAAQAREAQMSARIGQQAMRHNRRWLTAFVDDLGFQGAASLSQWLQVALLPEALRQVTWSPPTPRSPPAPAPGEAPH